MSYKKIIPIVVALGMFTFGSVNCKKEEPMNMKNYNLTPREKSGKLRQQISEYLGDSSYSMNMDKCEITAMNEPERTGMPQALVVIIKNKLTNDTIKLWDYYSDGTMEKAEYNGIEEVAYTGENYNFKGMEERFDQALELIKPGLEQKVKQAEEEQTKIINKAKDNTQLE